MAVHYPLMPVVAGPQLARPAGCWDRPLLAAVTELNELLLEVLRAAARADEPLRDGAVAGGTPPSAVRPRLIGGLRDLWQALDAAAQQRCAACPYLLLDAGFSEPARWDGGALSGGVRDADAPNAYFSGPSGVVLLRRALVLAWHLARSNRLTARVVLGMSLECAERIGGRALRELEALAESRPLWILPRWEAETKVWRQMIQAALDGRETALRRVQLRGLQLLAAAGAPRPAEAQAARPVVTCAPDVRPVDPRAHQDLP
jgi:hypothetical protein